jgi:outer membrane protein OmpA-like peptidoglycan-associated protein
MNKYIILAYALMMLCIGGSSYYANSCGCQAANAATPMVSSSIDLSNTMSNENSANLSLVQKLRASPLIFHFDTNIKTKDLSIEEQQYIEGLSEYLKSSPEQKITITGHTDNRGNFESNFRLGLKRANFVKNLLIEKGVNPDQLVTVSLAAETPVHDNQNEVNRAENRRAEVIL